MYVNNIKNFTHYHCTIPHDLFIRQLGLGVMNYVSTTYFRKVNDWDLFLGYR